MNDAALPEQGIEMPFLGVVDATSDWTEGWAFGLDQDFWFQQ